MCKELRFNRKSTTVYHPQENALIERTNRSIEKSLEKYMKKSLGKESSRHLGQLSSGSNDGVQIIKSLCYQVLPFLTPLWVITRAAD